MQNSFLEFGGSRHDSETEVKLCHQLALPLLLPNCGEKVRDCLF